MRVGGAVTYDVSMGHEVTYAGMTRDATEVYFTSNDQLTADDTDTSTDLFVWDEASDSISRVSTGSVVAGNTDACSAPWIAQCGVQVVPATGGGVTFDPNSSLFSSSQSGFPSDNSVAAQSGDVYFFSPEQLAGTDGIPGQRNLYVYHSGQVKFVAELGAATPITRMQVTPDGAFAAFITRSRLTSYDNGGYEEMYRCERDSGDVRCVSCDPTGGAATANTLASQNGLFMSDDGRVFFTTDAPILPMDTNNGSDVYEYVDSRARLITTGAETTDKLKPTGLVAVTTDGTDVYFTTQSTLTSDDRNGRFVKIYDARTGGGFPVRAEIAPCAAADECHGRGSDAVAAPAVASEQRLSKSGNASAPKCRRKGNRRRHRSAHARDQRCRRTKKKSANGRKVSR